MDINEIRERLLSHAEHWKTSGYDGASISGPEALRMAEALAPVKTPGLGHEQFDRFETWCQRHAPSLDLTGHEERAYHYADTLAAFTLWCAAIDAQPCEGVYVWKS